MSTYRTRVHDLKKLLESDRIDTRRLRELCFQGIPDESGLRPLCWRLLLGFLPADRSEWPAILAKQRSLYEQFVDDMIVSNQEGGTSPTEPDDHPLSVNPSSRWQAYFRDNEVLLQIDKDVRRLCPDMCFFQRPTEHPCTRIAADPRVQGLRERVQRSMLRAANVTRSRQGITNGGCKNVQAKWTCRQHYAQSTQWQRKDSAPPSAAGISACVRSRPAHEPLEQLGEGQEAHWEVVERILFLYAKLNPGLGYVQGMNEIIGPIYYTLVSDPNSDWRKYAEADCFFCFTSLMSEIRDFFIKTLDESSSGIGAMMERLMQLLRRRDDRLYGHLKQLHIEPQYYSFRWIMLLLSQDFPLPDVLRIWDSLFADPQRFTFLIYICYAMLSKLRDKLMMGDFPSIIKLLQDKACPHHVARPCCSMRACTQALPAVPLRVAAPNCVCCVIISPTWT
ncbi:TBC1 domain family member 13 isoform X2 [Dermacentor andersoni]|uniref:TBC1 domain family member 13 isoform X2 n=1 Tax=Dermacentor andersoni TaxID=34620 RepID=UPI00241630CB|nr:TBC1 domain family member 13-like isoform X2 [Dermacentor andersoni]